MSSYDEHYIGLSKAAVEREKYRASVRLSSDAPYIYFKSGDSVSRIGSTEKNVVDSVGSTCLYLKDGTHSHIENFRLILPARPSDVVQEVVTKQSSIAGSILTEAANIVGGDRNSTHGDKERSFQVIANLWNAYLSGRKTQGDITPFDVAQFMVLLKVARSIQGKPVRDHFTDAAGYSAIAGELVA